MRLFWLISLLCLASACGDDGPGPAKPPVPPAPSVLAGHLDAPGLFAHAQGAPILGATLKELRASFGHSLHTESGRHAINLPATQVGAGPQLRLHLHNGAVVRYRFELGYRQPEMRDVLERALARALGGRGRPVQQGALACSAYPVPHDRYPPTGAECPPARFACERSEVAVCHSDALAAVTVLVARATPPIDRAVAPAQSLAGRAWYSDGRGQLTDPLREPSATVLADGRVLFVGGIHWDRRPTEAVLYSPERGTVETVAGTAPRTRAHTATELADGTVLIVGGTPADVTRFHESLATVHRLDLRRRRWLRAPPLRQARYGHSAHRLPDGRVLVFGGTQTGAEFLRTSEIYDPASNRWTAGPSLRQGRFQHAAIRLETGDILVAGSGESGAEMTSERYSVESGTWSLSGALGRPWFGHHMALLPDRRVWLVGDSYAPGESRPHVASELYDPDTGTWTQSATDERSWLGFAAVPVAGGVLLVGGHRPVQKEVATEVTTDGGHPAVDNLTETLFFDPRTEKLYVGPNIPDTHTGDSPRALPLPAGDVVLLARESETVLLLRQAAGEPDPPN